MLQLSLLVFFMLSAIIIILIHSKVFYCLDVIYYALSFPKLLVLYIQLNDSIYLFFVVLFILNVLCKVFRFLLQLFYVERGMY